MLFSSPVFLTIFLPVTLFFYFSLNLRNVILLLMSLAFYAWGGPTLVLLLAFVIVANYFFGLAIDRAAGTPAAKIRLIAGVVLNLGLLILFKYLGFMLTALNEVAESIGVPVLPVPEIPLPLGLSFFTFQAISYLVDIYRGETRAEPSLINLAVFKSFFPQLIAGPIVRYGEISGELARRPVNTDDLGAGVERFVIGLAKKVLIADTLAIPADMVWGFEPGLLDMPIAWVGIVCFCLQIYFDFSGYTDMAIGLGRMFGFHFPENFNHPYAALSLREFWHRWHMTLSRWFRDYLYIPLGGNRGGAVRTGINLFVVFGLCGLWHGANWTFLIWGLWHGAFLILERTAFGRLIERLPTIVRRLYLLLTVLVGWVFFRAPSLDYALSYLEAMFGGRLGEAVEQVLPLFGPYMLAVLAAGCLFSFPPPRFLVRIMERGGGGLSRPSGMAHGLLYLTVFTALALLAFGESSAETLRAFIYFRF